VSLLSIFLAIIGVLAGLRLWPVLMHVLFWLTGLVKAKHDDTDPFDAVRRRVTRVLLAAGSAWFALFAGITVLLSQASARPGMWGALFLGLALTPCVAIGGYFAALRRLKRKARGLTDEPKGKVRTFLKWCSSSLEGHIVLFQFFGALPMFILFTYLNYTEGTLTFSWGIWIAFVAECFGIFMALFLWFTLSRWFVYLGRDTEAMKALMAKRRIKAVPDSDENHSSSGEG
jgi:hypothetical protein